MSRIVSVSTISSFCIASQSRPHLLRNSSTSLKLASSEELPECSPGRRQPLAGQCCSYWNLAGSTDKYCTWNRSEGFVERPHRLESARQLPGCEELDGPQCEFVATDQRITIAQAPFSSRTFSRQHFQDFRFAGFYRWFLRSEKVSPGCLCCR